MASFHITLSGVDPDFAVIWGVLLFAEWPDIWSFLGIALITLAGALALRK